LGKLVVNSPGTPVRGTNNLTDPAARRACHAYMFEALEGNTGPVYISLSATDDRTNLTQIVAILPTPSTNILPSFSAAITPQMNPLDVSKLYIDADNGGDGVIGSILIA